MSITPITQPLFDPNKYSGQWYRLASKFLIYEADCAGSSANYQYEPNGPKGIPVINVINTCVRDDGSYYSRTGYAYIPNYYDPGKLLLNFIDGLPSDGESNYWVHWTDYDNFSIVGGPSGQFLWILGRQKQATLQDLQKLTVYIKNLGYTIDDINIAQGVLI